MERDNTLSPKPEATAKKTDPATKKKGPFTRFLAWIARGAEKAAKDGELCGR